MCQNNSMQVNYHIYGVQVLRGRGSFSCSMSHLKDRNTGGSPPPPVLSISQIWKLKVTLPIKGSDVGINMQGHICRVKYVRSFFKVRHPTSIISNPHRHRRFGYVCQVKHKLGQLATQMIYFVHAYNFHHSFLPFHEIILASN